MPPSHWVNWRHMSSELSTASMSTRSVAPVAVKPGHRLEVRIYGPRELRLVREQVGKRAERRQGEPDQRDDEETLARPDEPSSRAFRARGQSRSPR